MTNPSEVASETYYEEYEVESESEWQSGTPLKCKFYDSVAHDPGVMDEMRDDEFCIPLECDDCGLKQYAKTCWDTSLTEAYDEKNGGWDAEIPGDVSIKCGGCGRWIEGTVWKVGVMYSEVVFDYQYIDYRDVSGASYCSEEGMNSVYPSEDTTFGSTASPLAGKGQSTITTTEDVAHIADAAYKKYQKEIIRCAGDVTGKNLLVSASHLDAVHINGFHGLGLLAKANYVEVLLPAASLEASAADEATENEAVKSLRGSSGKFVLPPVEDLPDGFSFKESVSGSLHIVTLLPEGRVAREAMTNPTLKNETSLCHVIRDAYNPPEDGNSITIGIMADRSVDSFIASLEHYGEETHRVFERFSVLSVSHHGSRYSFGTCGLPFAEYYLVQGYPVSPAKDNSTLESHKVLLNKVMESCPMGKVPTVIFSSDIQEYETYLVGLHRHWLSMGVRPTCIFTHGVQFHLTVGEGCKTRGIRPVYASSHIKWS